MDAKEYLWDTDIFQAPLTSLLVWSMPLWKIKPNKETPLSVHTYVDEGGKSI